MYGKICSKVYQMECYCGICCGHLVMLKDGMLSDGLLTLIYWFFYSSCEVLFLPPHYAEIINCYGVTWYATMVIYRGGGLQVFFELLSKCSLRFWNIFFITIPPVTFESVYHPTSLVIGFLSLEATRRFLMFFFLWNILQLQVCYMYS